MRKRDDIDRLHDEINELIDDLWQVPRFVLARRGFLLSRQPLGG